MVQDREETRDERITRLVTSIQNKKKVALERHDATAIEGFHRFDPSIEEVFQIIEDVSKAPLEIMNPTDLNSIDNGLKDISPAIDKVAVFHKEGYSDPKAEWNSLRQVVGGAYQAIRNGLSNDYARLRIRELESEGFQNKIATAIKRGDKQLQEIQHYVDQAKIDASAIKETASKLGASAHADIFHKQADQVHKVLATRWLITSCLMALVLIAVLLFVMFKVPSFGDMSDIGKVQYLVAKIMILSILYFSLIWSARNYRAHRHLEVVNKHRGNALLTYDAFGAGSHDPDAKDAILMEAARCIFSPSVTGYLGKEEDGQSHPIVNILRTMSKDGGSTG